MRARDVHPVYVDLNDGFGVMELEFGHSLVDEKWHVVVLVASPYAGAVSEVSFAIDGKKVEFKCEPLAFDGGRLETDTGSNESYYFSGLCEADEELFEQMAVGANVTVKATGRSTSLSGTVNDHRRCSTIILE